MMDDKFWAELDEDRCPCYGSGWAQTDLACWKECPIHNQGQLHPESRELLLDDPVALKEEERKSFLQFKINSCRETIAIANDEIKKQQKLLAQLELELINRTPTIKMVAVKPPPPLPLTMIDSIELDDGDFI